MPHRAHVNPAYVGALTMVVMAVVVAGIFISGIPGGPTLPLPWNSVRIVKAHIADADALAPHAGVQVAGVKIGEVQNVDSDGNQALVTMAIQPQHAGEISDDSKVLLRPHGLFGPKYIEIQPGTSGTAVADGGTLTGQATLPVDLDQVLHELQASERDQLRTAVVELGHAAASRGDDVNGLIKAGDSLSTVLDTAVRGIAPVNQGQLDDMLVQDESFNSAFVQAPLDQLVANNARVLAAFAQNSDHLQSLIVQADATLTNLDAALAGESGNIRTILERLPPVVDDLNRFNDLLTLFGANFSGKEPGVPDITQGLIAAIENPRSAFSSYNCTVKENPCQEQHKDYYLRVQSFLQQLGGLPGPLSIPSTPLGGSGLCGTTGTAGHLPACNGIHVSANGTGGLAVLTGRDIDFVTSLLAT